MTIQKANTKRMHKFVTTLIKCMSAVKWRYGILFILLLTSSSLQADPPDWDVNPAEYEFNMTGFIRVKTANNTFLNESSTMIGVFVEGEIRGVVDSSDIIFVEDAAYFPVTMYSNEQEGDTLDFQVYVGSIDSVFTSNETAIFNRVMTLGTPALPFILTIGWCIDVLVLGSEFSPISGIYRAGQEIHLVESILMTGVDTLILDAPLIKSNGSFDMGIDTHMVVRKDGCDSGL